MNSDDLALFAQLAGSAQNHATPDRVWTVTQMMRQCTTALVEGGAWPDAVLADAA